MSQRDHFDYEEKKRGWFRRFGFPLGLGFVALLVVVLLAKLFSGGNHAPPPPPREMVMIKPVAPPPPPPPPPPQPTPPRDEPKDQPMVEQTPDQAQDKPAEQPQDPSPALGTNVQGNGPADGFGLGHSGNGFLGGNGSSGNGGSRFGWYANKVVRAVSDALRQNPRTGSASFNIKVRIWSDPAGRVTRVKLADSTGDAAVDAAISNEVLRNFQLPEPPPEGMPMPISMRLMARRPL